MGSIRALYYQLSKSLLEPELKKKIIIQMLSFNFGPVLSNSSVFPVYYRGEEHPLTFVWPVPSHCSGKIINAPLIHFADLLKPIVYPYTRKMNNCRLSPDLLGIKFINNSGAELELNASDRIHVSANKLYYSVEETDDPFEDRNPQDVMISFYIKGHFEGKRPAVKIYLARLHIVWSDEYVTLAETYSLPCYHKYLKFNSVMTCHDLFKEFLYHITYTLDTGETNLPDPQQSDIDNFKEQCRQLGLLLTNHQFESGPNWINARGVDNILKIYEALKDSSLNDALMPHILLRQKFNEIDSALLFLPITV